MKTRTRVKICGITNRADAEMAIELGADALGFNAWPGSKRFIDLEKEACWIRDLPPFVAKVAVMVNPAVVDAEAVFALPFIDLVQFHGHEEPLFCERFFNAGFSFIKAISLRDEASLDDLGRFYTQNILLDSYAPGAFGGTGQLIDLDLVTRFASKYPDFRLTLSGGLNPENVKEIVNRVRPYAVDVASGVERDPRTKDRGRTAAFIQASGSVISFDL